MKFAIYPYKHYSKSAKDLSLALGCKRIKHESSRFHHWNSSNYFVINYGSSSCPSANNVLNSRLNVGIASNKLSYFNLIKDYCNVPEFTEDVEVAKIWFQRESDLVVCRTTLTGHSGQGIVIAETPEELVTAPLYTKYIRKDSEYRVHFAFNTEPIFVQKKMRRRETDVDNRVRSWHRGWIFANDGIILPDQVLDQAQRAFSASHLDFAAIDLVYRAKHDKATVLEANTAAGLTGKTLEAYKIAFLNLNNH